MATFQNPLWGFKLIYPDEWAQQSNTGVDGFAPNSHVFDQVGAVNEQAAHLLLRGEFNGWREPIAPLWNEHLTKLSLMMGAKKIKSAPFSMGSGKGFEAEIQLPQKVNRRLWVGILARGTTILHLLVSHPKDERDIFEPQATEIITSLKFFERMEGIEADSDGLPAPPQYTSIPPQNLIPDARDDEYWRAYEGDSDLGGLQAFYYRELPNHGWEINEFIPYPNQVDINFARIRIQKDNLSATLGILPFGEKKPFGKVVIKFEKVSQ